MDANYGYKCLICESNPCVCKDKDGKKYDDDKLRYDLMDPEFDEAVCKIITFGAKKYGPNNWQNLDNFWNRYYAALMRHIKAWRKGEEIDPESGEPHLAHAACNIMFLMWGGRNFTKKGNENASKNS